MGLVIDGGLTVQIETQQSDTKDGQNGNEQNDHDSKE